MTEATVTPTQVTLPATASLDPAGRVDRARDIGIVPLDTMKWARVSGKAPTKVSQVLNPGDFISTIAGTASAINMRVSGREVTQ